MFFQDEDILRGRCLISYQFILMKFLMIIYHSLTLKNESVTLLCSDAFHLHFIVFLRQLESVELSIDIENMAVKLEISHQAW